MTMRRFVIDCEKWACGFGPGLNPVKRYSGGNIPAENQNGVGPSLLLNRWGYSCCLGLIAQQCGVEKDDLYGVGMPSSIESEEGRARVDFLVLANGSPTCLAIDSARINDDWGTTVAEKIKLLKRLFYSHGIHLTFINVPTPTPRVPE